MNFSISFFISSKLADKGLADCSVVTTEIVGVGGVIAPWLAVTAKIATAAPPLHNTCPVVVGGAVVGDTQPKVGKVVDVVFLKAIVEIPPTTIGADIATCGVVKELTPMGTPNIAWVAGVLMNSVNKPIIPFICTEPIPACATIISIMPILGALGSVLTTLVPSRSTELFASSSRCMASKSMIRPMLSSCIFSKENTSPAESPNVRCVFLE